MSNIKISELPSASSLDGTEVAPVVQSGTTKKATVAMFGAADATAERIANKTSDIAGNLSSTVKYPNTKGVADYAEALANKTSDIAGNPTSTLLYPTAKGVVDYLNTPGSLPFITPQMYGAVADGVADDTAAMQAAHNTGSMVFYPEGHYLFSRITIANGGIIGMGPGVSKLYSTDTTSGDVIKYTGNDSSASSPPLFRDFELMVLNTKAGGAAIHISPTSGVLSYCNFENVFQFNSIVGIKLTNTLYGGMNRCTIINYTDAGIYYEVPYNPAAGDFVIQGCNINTGQATGRRYGIYQYSGGGLRIANNKILGGLAGVVLDYTGTAGSGPLNICSNSIENCDNYGIYLGCSSSGTFESIVISGNEIAQMNGAAGKCISSDNSGKLKNVVVTGNVMEYGSAAGAGVTFLNVNTFTITGNSIYGAANTAANIGINVNATCSNGHIGVNAFLGIPTTTNKIINVSSTTTVAYEPVRVYGTGSVTVTIPYGPINQLHTAPAINISFGVAYKDIPIISAYTDYNNGGCSTAIMNASTTGFSLAVFGVNVNAPVAYRWDAIGELP